MNTSRALFDAHCDTISRCLVRGEALAENSGQLDLERAGRYCPYAQFFAAFQDSAKLGREAPWQAFLRQYRLFRGEMEKNARRIVHCRTLAQAREAQAQGKAAAFLSVEGAELLECSEARLEEAWRLGVRAVNLTWNHANLLSGSHREEPERGLSPAGRAFVRRMGELGMIVDVSHLSDAGFWDVAELCTGPFMASHSNAREIFFHTRNLTDGQFTAIIEHHGVAGLNFYAGFLGEKPDLDTVIAHLEHFLALGGEENVALGTDLDGCDVLPSGVSGVEDVEELREKLLRRNYSETLVQKLFFDNLMRVVSEVCIM